MTPLLERYRDEILGTLSCFDRVVLTGSLPQISHAEVMVGFLRSQGVRLEDLPRYFEKLKNELIANAGRIAAEHGLAIEYLGKKTFRKDDRIKAIIKERGSAPGLVHIFSCVELCRTFRAVGTAKGNLMLRPRTGQCLHHYFYFIDPILGLCYVRVPTWAPFRLQIYFNGHNWLARQLAQNGIAHTLVDNVFVDLADWKRAQQLADAFPVPVLHRLLDTFATRYCPVVRHFTATHRWSVMQVEYATDIVFRSSSSLAPVYDQLVRTAVHAVKAEQVATFLGRKLVGAYDGELGTDFHTRIEGTRIKHHMGHASIKMYDKLGRVLRIETTASDVGFFKHRREVEHRDGTRSMKVASVQKTIYSLGVLAQLMGDANRRYLEFISALDDPSDGAGNMLKLAQPKHRKGRSLRGFNLFQPDDLALLTAIARGEFTISGMRNKHLQHVLAKSGPQISRTLARLRAHGLLKHIRNTYKYYLTRFGKTVVACALQVREFLVKPALSWRTTLIPCPVAKD